MAIIPLRQYNREIEGLVDTGQLDEAVAHCRHILESFPKHIATYRLLGKAYLELQRYGDAADIFQRVLSSVPDDYVANIGMSIIREDEGNLDAAIWYMERSSEAQPSNTAIKDELRRLYGRRDGIEPPKIRLTRGALARMYSKGGLYDQAIAELRAALAEDPQRPDLLVMLAQMHFHLGQQVEAVDACGTLIKRLPYCLVANRILAAILPRTERADDTKTFLQRSIAMDPYFASAAPNALTAESVPESAINIERLAYRPGMDGEGSAQPAWAASLGITLETNQAEQLPDWLQDQNAPLSTSPTEDIPAPTAPFSWEKTEDEIELSGTSLSPEEAIPDWLKVAGWQPATGAAQEDPGLPDFDQVPDQDEGDIAKADIPDWLKGLVPSEALDEEQPESEKKPAEVDLPWLQTNPPGASDTIVNWLGANKAAASETSAPDEIKPGGTEDSQEEIPDWLRDFQEPKLSAEISTPQSSPVISAVDTSPDAASSDQSMDKQKAPSEENGLPEWLRGVESSYGSSGITDWLNRATVDRFETTLPDNAPTKDEEAPPPWLKDFTEPSSEPIAETPPQPGELSDQDTALAWLESLAAQHGAKEEELITTPDERIEAVPDWIRREADNKQAEDETPTQPVIVEQQFKPEGVGEPALEAVEPVQKETSLPEEELPDWLKEMRQPTPGLFEFEIGEAETEQPALPAEDLPDWLKEMGETAPVISEIAEAEPADEEPALPAADLPDWLKEMGEPTPVISEVAEAVPAVEEPALPAADIPDWLKEMDETAPVISEVAEAVPAVEEPALLAADLPDWLKEMGEPTPVISEVAEAVPGVEEPALSAADLPDWLKEMGEPAPVISEVAEAEPAVEEPALPAADLPDWLMEMGATAPVISEVTEAEPAVEEPVLPAADLSDLLSEMGGPAAEFDLAEPAQSTVETSAMPGELTDQDVALAWLESLAAHHGAREEELITKPNERLEVIPDWVQREVDEIVPEDETPTQPIIVEQQLPPEPQIFEPVEQIFEPTPEPTGTELVETTQPEEELPDWLKDFNDPAVEAEEALTEETIPSGELPDWLLELTARDQAAAEPVSDALIPGIEELPAWLSETSAEAGIDQEEAFSEPLPAPFDTTELPDWLSEAPTPALEQAGNLDELPDWLKEIPQAASDELQIPTDKSTAIPPAWMPEAILPGAPEELEVGPALETPVIPVEVEPQIILPEPVPAPDESLPQPVNINTSSLAHLEQLPGVGFVLAQNIIEYRETHGKFTELSELINVDGFEPALLGELGTQLTTGISEVIEKEVAVIETEEMIFRAARQAVERGETEAAVGLYNRLVSQGSNLDQVIVDMRDALYRFPLDITFWQLLGDAYIRTDQLQEALDAYTEAEELLR